MFLGGLPRLATLDVHLEVGKLDLASLMHHLERDILTHPIATVGIFNSNVDLNQLWLPHIDPRLPCARDGMSALWLVSISDRSPPVKPFLPSPIGSLVAAYLRFSRVIHPSSLAKRFRAKENNSLYGYGNLVNRQHTISAGSSIVLACQEIRPRQPTRFGMITADWSDIFFLLGDGERESSTNEKVWNNRERPRKTEKDGWWYSTAELQGKEAHRWVERKAYTHECSLLLPEAFVHCASPLLTFDF